MYGRKGFRTYLKPEGRELREYIVSQVKGRKSLPTGKLKVKVDIYENWLTKKGEVKRVDIANREKFLIDSIFEGLGIDDKYIFLHEMQKIQSIEEKAIITISSI